MTGTVHNRPDGTECPYLAAGFCNKCGWHDPILSAGTGARLIAAERRRQVTEEGWTAEHDMHHDHGQLARAAACYALHGSGVRQIGPYPIGTAWPWPWPDADFKPGNDRIRELVKAGALIAAEIDRLTAVGESR